MATKIINSLLQSIQHYNRPASDQNTLLERYEEEIAKRGYDNIITRETFSEMTTDPSKQIDVIKEIHASIIESENSKTEEDTGNTSEDGNSDDFPMAPEKETVYGVVDINLDALTRFRLTNLFLTIPGEIVGDQNMGIGIRTYLFSQDSGRFEDLYSRIVLQIKKYIPYIVIYDLQFSVDTVELPNDAISIRLQYGYGNDNRILLYAQNFS